MATLPAREQGERIVTLDIIRGIAVMGIFSVNVIGFALIFPAYLNPTAAGGASGADLGIWLANHILIDEKMRSLFSILFGASSLLVVERALAKGESAARTHYARMAVLFVLGLMHFYLIWFGDILASYAFAGMAAYFFLRRKTKTMLIWAVCLLSLNAAMFSAGSWQFHRMEQKVATGTATAKEAEDWKKMSQFAIPDPKRAAEDTAIHKSKWPERTARRFEKQKFEPLAGVMPFFFETLGLMLIGMAGLRSGFLTGDWSPRAYRRVAVGGLAIGIIFSTLSGLALIRSGFPPWLLLGANYGFGMPAHLAMALGYAALIVLLARRGWLGARVAATGRAAFTNYVGTSVLASLVFYGDGLGLFGQLSRFEAWLFVPLFWGVMLLWSKPWLDRFQYGPLEWVWRSLARGKPQPMRKRAGATLLPAGA